MELLLLGLEAFRTAINHCNTGGGEKLTYERLIGHCRLSVLFVENVVMRKGCKMCMQRIGVKEELYPAVCVLWIFTN